MTSDRRVTQYNTPGKDWPAPLSGWNAAMKRIIDFMAALAGLALTWWLILLVIILARMDTGLGGLFRQERVGRFGRPFYIYKIRTMRPVDSITTNVTTDNDRRITGLGRIFRKAKLDELPQLWNVLRGEMSLVGPRPDVQDVYDMESEEVRIVLSVRPGITGPATIKYRNEEKLLAAASDAERYNSEVIFPDKLRINRLYVENYRLVDDFKYIWRTVFR